MSPKQSSFHRIAHLFSQLTQNSNLNQGRIHPRPLASATFFLVVSGGVGTRKLNDRVTMNLLLVLRSVPPLPLG